MSYTEAKEKYVVPGMDTNPAFFFRPKCGSLTLSGPNEDTTAFWVEHGKACVRIYEKTVLEERV